MRFWSLNGYLPYSSVSQLQQRLVELRHKEWIPDTVLFLEHQPVITRGRGLQFTGVQRPRQMPLLVQIPPEVEFAESERGGDLTYHGPGQWVMYPICKLDGRGFAPKHDVAGFLRKLESILIEELASYQIQASIKPNATGVWVQDKKIASIGIAIRKWVTFHGLALNCVNDLKPFYLISPCGFSPDVMTRLADFSELDSNWRFKLQNSIAKRFDSEPQIVSLSFEDAIEQVSQLEFQLQSESAI